MIEVLLSEYIHELEGNCSYDAALCVGVSLERSNCEDLLNIPRHA